MARDAEKYCFFQELLTPEVLATYFSNPSFHEKPRNRDCEIESDLSEGCGNDKCILRAIAERVYEPAELEQYRCIQDFQWCEGVNQHRPIEPTEAIRLWTHEGFAKRFREVLNYCLRNGKPLHHEEIFHSLNI